MSSHRDKKSQLFDLEKILTVSARDYCDSVGKNLSDYKMVGVHAQKLRENHPDSFLVRVPKETEVVVDYKPASYTGTALIPKNKTENKPTPYSS